jgi:hypothetical protein
VLSASIELLERVFFGIFNHVLQSALHYLLSHFISTALQMRDEGSEEGYELLRDDERGEDREAHSSGRYTALLSRISVQIPCSMLGNNDARADFYQSG